MTPERWARIDAVLDEALDRPAGERAAFLDAACGTDAELRAEVERLLAASEDPDGPISDEPAAVFAASLVARTLGTGVDERADAPVRHPERVGPWRVVEPAGAGGMGAVYVVERADGAFRMKAALKLVRRGLHLDEHFLRRFRDERQILARLVHPNIARLLDGGVTADGLPYYVMEFVDGAPIDRWCDARQLSVEARLALFAKVCDAVAYAHQHRVVHRDLKPSNILVTPEGEPKLLDFGIAKLLAPDGDGALQGTGERSVATALTRTGQRLLTPEYASPEQIRSEPVTAASDVYALGVILYELLTGRRPYACGGRTAHEIERAVLEEEPVRPSSAVTRGAIARAGGREARDAEAVERDSALARDASPAQLRRRLRGDLDAVVLTALRKEPTRRYGSAGALAADVRRHLEGRAVLARGDGPAYHLRKWGRRHRGTLVSVAVGIATGVAALAGVASRRAGDDVPGLATAVSTTSTAAARYYRDGLQAYGRGNYSDAVRLFRAALGEDSTFALAALYTAEAAQRDENYDVSRAEMERAVRLAAHASEHDRLLVMAYRAERFRDAALGAYADSLATRYPSDPEGQLRAGRAAFWRGDFPAALRFFRRVATMDSMSIVRGSAPCHACEAWNQIGIVYQWSDSLDAAEREARTLARLLPDAVTSWRQLALAKLMRGDDDETAFRRAIALDPGATDYAAEWSASRRIRHGDFHGADAIARARIETAPASRQEVALGILIISLRNQERWTEALELAHRFRQLEPEASPGAAPVGALHEAQVLLEMGRPLAAAALFDSVSRWRSWGAGMPASTSHRLWHQTHRADALAAAGDTGALPAIIDTVRALAARSAYGRDPRLAHHVRGLLLQARGDDAGAVAEFRRAIFSPNLGYTRTNLAMARSLLRLGRPREAVAVLQPALRGSLEVNNFYVTHTALHDALGDAWAAAGNADSAAAHRAWVAHARGERLPTLANGAEASGPAAAAVRAASPGRIEPGAARRIAFDAGLELDPVVSPDGSRIAYAADVSGAMRIYVRPLEGGPATMLAPGVAGYQRLPRWSPDGRQLAFQAGKQIWSVPAAGGAPRVLVRPAAGARWVGSPAWSPDGRRIAYVQDWQLHVRDVAGGPSRVIPQSAVGLHSLTWSPDGRWIAFVDDNSAFVIGARGWGSPVNLGNTAPSAIWIVPAAGGEPVPATDSRALNTSPVWTPDSRGLLYVSSRDGDRDVYHLALDDAGRPLGAPARVTAGLGAHTIALSRDGRRLAYAVYRSASNVWALPVPARGTVTHAAARPVTAGTQSIEGLGISADGRWLAFDSDRAGSQDIWRVRTSGGEPTALTSDPADEFLPAWSPDATEIVYYAIGPDGARRLAIIPAAGGTPQPLPLALRDQRYPGWSPDARSVVFDSYATGRPEVYVVSRDRLGRWGTPRQLTRAGGASGRFSPDGRTILYTRADGLWAVSPAGGAPRQVLRTDPAEEASLGVAQWSPDGRTIWYKWVDELGQASIRAIPATCAREGARAERCRPQVVAWLGDPRRQSARPEFVTDGRSFYLTIAERASDVWTMELQRRP